MVHKHRREVGALVKRSRIEPSLIEVMYSILGLSPYLVKPVANSWISETIFHLAQT
jgi:hypothetical protein